MNPRGRRTAALLFLFVIAMLIAGGIAFRRPLLEEWYIRRLGSDDERVQAHAARKLAELRSVRALPALFERVVEDYSVNSDVRAGFPSVEADAMDALGEEAVPFLVDRLTDPQAMARRASVSLLRRLGPRASDAVEALARVVQDPAEAIDVRLAAVLALGSIGPDAEGALPALRSARGEIDLAAVREAIERIEADYD